MARAKIFKHGGSQAVRLPKEFRFEGDEVNIRREGDAVIIEPAAHRPHTEAEWEAFWAKLDSLRGDELFPEREQPEFEDRDLDF